MVSVREFLPVPFDWRVIPAGSVTLTGGDDWAVAAFELAQYPVTNPQFQVFLDDADGYASSVWWDFSRRAARWHLEHGPAEVESDGPMLPRVSVSWYEAFAFCRWLSAKTGDDITLPTEQEWQRAAQGDDGRIFAWGNASDISRCNASESGIKCLTPVDAFPTGASAFGVFDMGGNAAEWCLNAYNVPDDVDVATFSGGEARAMRGGSYGLSLHNAQVAFRSFNHPGDRFDFLGFRLGRHP
jgi:formylglycine-generating enzyme required for sulfatase activity